MIIRKYLNCYFINENNRNEKILEIQEIIIINTNYKVLL